MIKELKYTTSIHDYVKEFSTLMLQNSNMSKKDLIFNFIDGLKPWVAQELKHGSVNNISTVLNIIETLEEFEYYKNNNFLNPRPPRKIVTKVGEQRSPNPHITKRKETNHRHIMKVKIINQKRGSLKMLIFFVMDFTKLENILKGRL